MAWPCDQGCLTYVWNQPGNVGRPFLTGGSITYLPAFILTFIVQVLLRTAVDAILRLKGETTMTSLNTWTKTKLRNVPRIAVDLGLNFTIAVVATINGPGAERRGRFHWRLRRGPRATAFPFTQGLRYICRHEADPHGRGLLGRAPH